EGRGKWRSRWGCLWIWLGADGRPPATSLLQREAEFTILPNRNDPLHTGTRFRQMIRNGAFSEPGIDHFVMAITAAQAKIWHTAKSCRGNSRQCSVPIRL